MFTPALTGHYFTDDFGEQVFYLTFPPDTKSPNWDTLLSATIAAIVPEGPTGGVKYRVAKIRPIADRPYAQLILEPADRWQARMERRWVSGRIGSVNVKEFRFEMSGNTFVLRRSENGIYRAK